MPFDPAEWKGSGKGRFNDWQFIQYELSESERQQLKGLPVWDENWDSWLDRFCEAGCRITLKYDTPNRCRAAFASTVDEKAPNGKLVLSGRGSTTLKALRQLLFKHYVSAGGDWHTLMRGSIPQEFDD